MVDANQAWTPPEAVAMSRRLAEFNPAWLEEPIAADASMAEWQALAKAIVLPLAAGENMRGAAMFSQAIASGALCRHPARPRQMGRLLRLPAGGAGSAFPWPTFSARTGWAAASV